MRVGRAMLGGVALLKITGAGITIAHGKVAVPAWLAPKLGPGS